MLSSENMVASQNRLDEEEAGRRLPPLRSRMIYESHREMVTSRDNKSTWSSYELVRCLWLRDTSAASDYTVVPAKYFPSPSSRNSSHKGASPVLHLWTPVLL